MGTERWIGLQLPHPPPGAPLASILRRFGLALALVVVNWLIVVAEADGYEDNLDGEVTAIDALYYTTVTLSTTGYGDITPITQDARLVNAVVVTPMRLLFVIILVGTTIQALTERTRVQFRVSRWRSRVKDHVVVCGYGTKGRNAIRAMLLKGMPKDRVVVIESDPEARAQAGADGFVTVGGSAARPDVLLEAHVQRASLVLVALNRDDTAVLVTLAARRLAPHVTVAATAREAENADLLRQSGATSVIVSSETTGRLLGLAAHSPDTVDVVEDLLSFGRGLDLAERAVRPDEVGKAPHQLLPPVLAVLRGHRRLYYTDPEAQVLQEGDRLVEAHAPVPAPPQRRSAAPDTLAT